MVLTIRWLASLQTREPHRVGKYPVVQPLRVIRTPEDGVRAHATHPSDNPDGSEGFISVVVYDNDLLCGWSRD
jgi:hypothetical protein